MHYIGGKGRNSVRSNITLVIIINRRTQQARGGSPLLRAVCAHGPQVPGRVHCEGSERL